MQQRIRKTQGSWRDLGLRVRAATVLLIVPGTPARASGFNRQGAVNDANYWAHRTRGHPFERFGGTDCTNFVSHAWHFGGGLNMTDNWYVRDHHTWYPGDDNRDNTASWSVAVAFSNYMVNARKIAHYEKNDPSNAFNSANLGDAILYNWGRGHGWSHLTIEVGWDRNGDKIDQHSPTVITRRGTEAIPSSEILRCEKRCVTLGSLSSR